MLVVEEVPPVVPVVPGVGAVSVGPEVPVELVPVVELVVPLDATHDGMPALSIEQVSELLQQVIELIPVILPPQQVVFEGHTFHSFGEGK